MLTQRHKKTLEEDETHEYVVKSALLLCCARVDHPEKTMTIYRRATIWKTIGPATTESYGGKDRTKYCLTRPHTLASRRLDTHALYV